MYAGARLLSPYFQDFSPELQQIEEYFCCSQFPNDSTAYHLGEEDLFKAPQPIIEEPLKNLDPMITGVSMISLQEDVIFPQGLNVFDIENEQLLSTEAFYECEKDLLDTEEILNTPFFEDLNIDSTVETDQNLTSQGLLQQNVNSGCVIDSADWIHNDTLGPNSIDLNGTDYGHVYSTQRVPGEGDIQILSNGSRNVVHFPVSQPQVVNGSTSEDRKEKLARYRNKKNKRNFSRKIKYACRKALADTQPRIRGRFAKPEMSASKM